MDPQTFDGTPGQCKNARDYLHVFDGDCVNERLCGDVIPEMISLSSKNRIDLVVKTKWGGRKGHLICKLEVCPSVLIDITIGCRRYPALKLALSSPVVVVVGAGVGRFIESEHR